MPRSLNTNSLFNHGERLKQLFEKIFNGAEFAIDEEHFTVQRSFDDFGPNNEYIKSGNQVYRKENLIELLVAGDLIHSVSFIENKNDNVLPEGLVNRLNYYRRFTDEIENIIKAESIKDEFGDELSVTMAFRDYGVYRWEQIPRFDARDNDFRKSYRE